MKKLILSLIVLLSILLISCGGKGKNYHCWNIETTYLTLVNPSNMEPEYDIY